MAKPRKKIKPDHWHWMVIDQPWKPKRLHLEDGPSKYTRGPLREPVGFERSLPKCEKCLAWQLRA
jgi:hypothetical protein